MGTKKSNQHKKHSEKLFGADIINVMQIHVDDIVKQEWKDDKYPPEFWVTLENDDENDQKIMISISHLDNKFSSSLFPRLDTHYGYDSVLDLMINMYNQTM